MAGRSGIPVYVRNLVEGLAAGFPGDRLLLYGHGLRMRRALAGARTRPEFENARLLRGPVPARAAEVLARLGFGPDRLVGGCDVFHLTEYAWLGRPQAPLVTTVHDVLFEELPSCYTARMRRGLRHVTRVLVRESARIVVPSVRTKIGVVERFGADPERVDVVPLAPRRFVENAAGSPPESRGRPYVLAVGTVEPRKNLARTLAAHARLVTRGIDADLVVVGQRGWLTRDAMDAVARSSRVTWEESASDERLGALYRGAAALAYPSLGEGYGLPVAEAMAMGVPVVTSAGTACAEVAGDAALLVDPYSVDAIEGALGRILEDPSVAAALRARGLTRAAGWSWEATAAATRAAYERAAAA